MSFTYNTGVPAAPNNPSNDQPQMLINTQAINAILGVDHVTFNNAAGGEHKQVTFEANNIPTPPVTPPVLFTNTVAGLAQLFFYSGDAAHSSSQYVTGSNGSVVLLGGLIMKWAVVSTGSVQNLTTLGVANFPNNAFGGVSSGIIGSFFNGNSAVRLTTSTVQVGQDGSSSSFVIMLGN